MKNSYFFILGRNTALSVAEIESVLGELIISRELANNIYIINTKDGLNPMHLQLKLGGTIKIGKIFCTADQKEIKNKIIDYIKENKIDKKLNFAINSYGCDWPQRASLEIKKQLRQEGINSRVVESKEKILSSVVTKKQVLDKGGIEINCIKSKNKIFLGQTLTCQPFEELSMRDWQRPGKDEFSGMLPPKVAQIMLNLSQADKNQIILDPFAGSGTIIMEAALMGYKNLIGSDISKQAIADSEKNLSWLVEKGVIGKRDIKSIDFFISDVKNLSDRIKDGSIDAIVTEPYLGPAQRKGAAFSEIKKIKQELEQLYFNAFRVFNKILKTNGRVVIIFPVFMQKENIYLEIIEKIKKLGFEIIDPISHTGFNFSEITKREGILYSRPKQRIGREIIVFVKK